MTTRTVTTRRVSTMYRGDPVSVRVDPDDSEHLHLRIGPPERGKSRYAVLNRGQAIRVAINILRTVNELP